MASCDNCIHLNVCKHRVQYVSVGTKTEGTTHDCEYFKSKNGEEIELSTQGIFCATDEMAIYILEFIKRGYKEKYPDGGVEKYLQALQRGIDALNTVQKQKVEIKTLSELYDRSVKCICNIDNHLYRGATNDWAVEEIQEWDKDIKEIRRQK